MGIERGISDVRTIKQIIIDLQRALACYGEKPSEANLRGVGNMAGLLEERVRARRQKEA